jgi:hypothetical protein
MTGERRHTELASDGEIGNLVSQATDQSLGFEAADSRSLNLDEHRPTCPMERDGSTVMGIGDFLEQFNWSQFALFVLFALPGFISLQVWTLIVPASQRSFVDTLPEATAFGVLNAMVAGPLVVLGAPADPWHLYALLVGTLVGLPILWPFVLKWLMQGLYRWNLILNPAHNGWDAAFLRREPFFAIIHLKDGRRIGGYYGYRSYAGVHPASGHLYLESLWSMDIDGNFVDPVPGSRGLILRQDDYHFVELLGAQ